MEGNKTVVTKAPMPPDIKQFGSMSDPNNIASWNYACRGYKNELEKFRACKLDDLVRALRPIVAMTFKEAQAAEDRGQRVLYCQADPLNPCWDNRKDDVPGQHWGGGDACPECNLRAALSAAEAA